MDEILELTTKIRRVIVKDFKVAKVISQELTIDKQKEINLNMAKLINFEIEK